MSERNFNALLRGRFEKGFRVCVGLDPDVKEFPKHIYIDDKLKCIGKFCKSIVEAVHDLVAAFKPNCAFFERYGPLGIKNLSGLFGNIYIYVDIPYILDGKRGDIGNSSKFYRDAAFKFFGADAITVNPFMGDDSVEPFLADSNKNAFILAKTSNPGSRRFQDKQVIITPNEEPELFEELMRSGSGHNSLPQYLYVAYVASKYYNGKGNCGLVVGANHVSQIKQIRQIVGPEMILLLPGAGTQSGLVKGSPEEEIAIGEMVSAAKNHRGDGFLVNLSRSVLYASKEKDCFEAARAEVVRVNSIISKFC